jgi:hypothetical protein
LISLIINKKEMDLIVDTLGFLVKNPYHLKKSKDLVGLQREIWELMLDKSALEHDIKNAKYLYEYYDSMIERLRNC